MNNKKANTKFFYLRSIILFLLFILIFNLYGQSANSNYFPSISNPFHDVFYSYANYNKSEAKRLLKKRSGRFFKNQAYINYGLILEYEENYPEAEFYYRKALNNNEKISITYLHNLYNKHNRQKSLPLLFALRKNINSCWIDYEIAVHYAENIDDNKAMDYLAQAIDRGFSSADLLINDPAFDSIKKSYSFKRLIKKAKKNYNETNSITQQMKAARYEYEKEKSYGMLNELHVAAYYEKSGRESKALSILSSLVKSRLSFRDRSIALFWLARINAHKGRKRNAKQYLTRFVDHITGQGNDPTGYKDLVAPIYKDVILNDRYLRNIGMDMIN